MKIKKLLSVIMAAIMAVSVLLSVPLTVSATNEIQTRIDRLRSKYPNGKYWNHYANSHHNHEGYGGSCKNTYCNNPDKYTDHPCTTHSGRVEAGGYDCNNFEGSIQCQGFAKKVFYDIFEVSVGNTEKNRRYDFENIKIGDFFKFKNKLHYGVVISKSGNNITLVEANRHEHSKDCQDCNCRINWDRSISTSEIEYYKRASNYNSVNQTHTHSYERGYEAAHPHKIYMKCSCGDFYYNGETTTMDNCELCHPPVPGRPTFNVIATDETKATGFTWSKVLDAHHYDLRVWKKSDNEEILKVYNIVGTDYSYIFPAGDYYADVCSVDENKNYTGAGKIDFTVKEISTDLQPTGTAVFGNKIFAVFENTVNYDYAKAVCEKMGGHLASIHNKDEQDAIYNLISGKNAAFWLGGSDSEAEGVWKWEDGTPWDYDKWAEGEPNNDTTYLWCENFLEISSYTGLWNDVPYRYNFNYGFIAEFYIDEIAYSQSNSEIRTEYDSDLKYYIPVSKYILFNKAVPWEVAEAYCESLGGHLATITSSSENSTVLSIIENGTYLLGGTDKYNEGSWKWVNDESFTYSNWKSGEPNDYAQGEDYASISSNGWNDRPNVESVGFICEIDIADTYPEKPQIEVEVVGNEIYAWWNKCDKADRYNAYLTYYMTEEDFIRLGGDPEAYDAGVFAAEDEKLNTESCYAHFVAKRDTANTFMSYRIKVEAINSITGAKTLAFSEPINIIFIRGDINGDGAVNNKDLTRLFQYLSDWEVNVNEPALDINGDGMVNNKDLTRLFQYLSDWNVEIF